MLVTLTINPGKLSDEGIGYKHPGQREASPFARQLTLKIVKRLHPLQQLVHHALRSDCMTSTDNFE